MLCVTVTGRTMEEVRRARDGAIGADIIEVRLDGVESPDAAGAIEGRLRPVIVTCRPAWEGGAFRQRVADGDPIAVRMITEERWDVIPNAERADVFSARVRRAVARIAAAHPDQRVAAFAHGGTIAEILAQATGSRPFALAGADNASISHLVVTGDRWVLRRFNDTTHLDAGLTVAATPPT